MNNRADPLVRAACALFIAVVILFGFYLLAQESDKLSREMDEVDRWLEVCEARPSLPECRLTPK